MEPSTYSGFRRFTPTLRGAAIAVAIICVFGFGCDRKKLQKTPDIQTFDSIVDSTLKKYGFKDKDRFEFKMVTQAGQRHYVSKYLFDRGQQKTDDQAHWIVAISVAKAGEFIDVAQYAKNEKEHPTASKPIYARRYVDVDFINIPTSYSPVGLFSGMSMTTIEERFDIRIMASNLLPDGVSPPEFYQNKVGRMILERYAALSR